jgi:hypothetical protein
LVSTISPCLETPTPGILQNIKKAIGIEYKAVSAERVSNVINGLKAFKSGESLFREIESECAQQGLKLAFVHGGDQRVLDTDRWAFCGEKSPGVLYISLSEAKREIYTVNTAHLNGEEVRFERKTIYDKDFAGQIPENDCRLESPKTVEGYLMGHELSHARKYLELRPQIKEAWESFIESNKEEIESLFSTIKEIVNLKNRNPRVEPVVLRPIGPYSSMRS